MKRGIMILACAMSSAGAYAGEFVVEEAQRRVEYVWISNSMQQYGMDEIVSYSEGPYQESLQVREFNGDYTVHVDTNQDSVIEPTGITASGNVSYYFEAGEFAQGAHADIDASSEFFFMFEPTAPGPATLSGALTQQGRDTRVQVTLRDWTNDRDLFTQVAPGDFSFTTPLSLGRFYTLSVSAVDDFFIDDRWAFKVSFSGQAGYEVRFAMADDPFPCEDVKKFKADCKRGGKVKSILKLIDDRHAGKDVVFGLDEEQITLPVIGDKAKLVRGRLENGDHVVSVLSPARCVDPRTVTCP